MRGTSRRLMRDGAVLCGIALLSAAMFVIGVWQWGVGVDADAVDYVRYARRISAGSGVLSFPTLPNGYPMSLSLFESSGIDSADGALPLHASVLVVTGLVLGLAVRLNTGSLLMAALTEFLVVMSPGFLDMYLVVATEPLFFFTLVIGVVLLGFYADNHKLRYLVPAVLMLAGAVSARYAGIAFVPVVVVTILWFGPRSVWRRVLQAAVAAGVTVGPFLLSLWAQRGSGKGGGASVGWHPWSTVHTWKFLGGVSRWFLPVDIPPVYRAVIMVGLGVAIVTVVIFLWRNRSETPEAPTTGVLTRLPVVFGLCTVFYFVFLLATISFKKYELSVGTRIQSPMFVFGFPCLMMFLYRQVRMVPRSKARAVVVGLLIVGLLGCLGHAVRTTRLVTRTYDEGLGYTAKTWRKSEMIRYLKQLDTDGPVYSNHVNAVQWLAEVRRSRKMPLIRNRWGTPQTRFAQQVDAMVTELREHSGVVAYFRPERRQRYPDEIELCRQAPLIERVRLKDGSIYRLKPNGRLP